MDLKSIVDITIILSFIGATISGIIGICAFLNQTRISITLMSHGERERHKIIRGIVIFIMFVFLCFIICFSLNIGGTLFKANQQQKIANSIAPTQKYEDISDNSLDNQYDKLGSEEQSSKKTEIISKVFLGLMFLIALIASIVYTERIRKKEKGRTQYYKVRKWYRYFEIGFLFFCAMLLLEIGAVFALGLSPESFIVAGIVISCLHAIFLTYALFTSTNEYSEEIAKLKSYYNKKVVYLFELEDDYFVAGDNMYISDCEEFQMIPLAKLDEPLVDAQSEDDVYLKKENVEIGKGSKYNRNSMLRCVAADCKKREIDLNSECKLNIELVDKRIKYTVINDKTNGPFIIEDKPINREEWNGNVLLL